MSTPLGTDHGLTLTCRVLHPGAASGPLTVLDEPVSFWGGVSADGTIIDARHPQRGESVTGVVLAMEAGRGSSSSSSVLAEQIRSGAAPAAIVLAEPDVILVLGAAVAAEIYGIDMPIVQIDPADFAALPQRGWAQIITGDGARAGDDHGGDDHVGDDHVGDDHDGDDHDGRARAGILHDNLDCTANLMVTPR